MTFPSKIFSNHWTKIKQKFSTNHNLPFPSDLDIKSLVLGSSLYIALFYRISRSTSMLPSSLSTLSGASTSCSCQSPGSKFPQWGICPPTALVCHSNWFRISCSCLPPRSRGRKGRQGSTTLWPGLDANELRHRCVDQSWDQDWWQRCGHYS